MTDVATVWSQRRRLTGSKRIVDATLPLVELSLSIQDIAVLPNE